MFVLEKFLVINLLVSQKVGSRTRRDSDFNLRRNDERSRDYRVVVVVLVVVATLF